MHSQIFLSELFGTTVLVLLGTGVGANVNLKGTKGTNSGNLAVHLGWGLAVFAGVFVAFASGAHLNPAVTFGLWASGQPFYGGDAELGLAPVPAGFLNAVLYVVAQVAGAIIGAVIAWLAYKKHFDANKDLSPADTLNIFATGPAIRSYGWNVLTEGVATFVLVFVIILFGRTPSGLGPLSVALLVVVIGIGLGGPTGYAINPARDLGPRLVHAILPIPGKGGSDWAYSWVPILGPILGGVAAGLAATALQGALGL